MEFLNWYKFILTGKKYSTADKLEFIGGHFLFLFSLFFLFKAIVNFDEADKYLGLCSLFLVPILIKIRKSYKKFTLPFDKHNFQNKEMTDQQKELLNVKEKLIESAENSTKII